MDAREMAMAQRDIRSKSLDLLGFYHSHTFSPARPSQTDITIAMEFESYRTKLNLPEALHLIVSLETADNPDIRAYRIQDSQATEISIQRPSC
jgi:proteasome lid subunit RPN8/RPN11